MYVFFWFVGEDPTLEGLAPKANVAADSDFLKVDWEISSIEFSGFHFFFAITSLAAAAYVCIVTVGLPPWLHRDVSYSSVDR